MTGYVVAEDGIELELRLKASQSGGDEAVKTSLRELLEQARVELGTSHAVVGQIEKLLQPSPMP